MKQPEDRPSVSREIGTFLGHLFVAFDESAVRRSIAIMALRPNHRVLAVGYAPQLMDALTKAAPEGLIEAVDDPKTIERARKKYAQAIAAGHLNVAEGDEEHLPFARDFFDRIVVVERFEHWMNPATGLGEVQRVLRPDGMLVIALRKLEKGTIKKEAARLNEIAKAPNRDELLLAQLRESGFIKGTIDQERFAVARKPLNFTQDAPRT